MDLMITVSYSLKIPRDDFFHAENGTIKDEIEEQLEKLFPAEIALTADTAVQREHRICYPLVEHRNCLRCAACGMWLYMPGKEYLPACLEYCKMVKQIPLCPSCAWELEKDLENEEFVRKLREKCALYDTDKITTETGE